MNAQIDVTDIRIETPRLILRPWERSDLEDFYAYASVPGVGEMAGWNHHRSQEESQTILDMFISGKKTFALERKESGTVIGSLGVEKLPPSLEAAEGYGREIGYVLGKAWWGRGLMPEAVRAVTTYCFEILHYDYLTCGHFLKNTQSRRVIEKCGFSFFQESDFETQYGTVERCRDYIIHNPNK